MTGWGIAGHQSGGGTRSLIGRRVGPTGEHRRAVGRGRTIGRPLSGLSCFPQRQTEAAAFALPGQCSGVTRIISARRQKHLPPLPPTAYIHHCVLWRPSIWYVGHGHCKANKRSTDSRRGATGDDYPAHNRPIVGRSLVLILGSREIPFSGSRKKIETRDSRVLLTS